MIEEEMKGETVLPKSGLRSCSGCQSEESYGIENLPHQCELACTEDFVLTALPVNGLRSCSGRQSEESYGIENWKIENWTRGMPHQFVLARKVVFEKLSLVCWCLCCCCCLRCLGPRLRTPDSGVPR